MSPPVELLRFFFLCLLPDVGASGLPGRHARWWVSPPSLPGLPPNRPETSGRRQYTRLPSANQEHQSVLPQAGQGCAGETSGPNPPPSLLSNDPPPGKNLSD